MQYSFQIPIYQTIIFWLCVGLFVYFTGSFFFILLAVNSTSNEQIRNEAIVIFSFVTIIKNIILGLAFLKSESEDISHENSLNVPNDLNLDNFTPNNNQN